jgi:hypothetical protein
LGGPSRKGLYAELWTDDVKSGQAGVEHLSSSEPLATSVKLSFDSNSKIFSASYGSGDVWEPFGSFGVSDAEGGVDGNGNWNMTDTDQFCIAVYGYSEHMSIASGRVYGDNFYAEGVTTPLTTRILKPTPGEPVPAGKPYIVEWEAPLDATKFKLQYSTDNGSTWKAMTPGFVTGRSHEWQVPVPLNNKSKCLVRLNAYWVGYTGSDVKIGTDVSEPFTIEVVRLTSPSKGDPALTSGGQHTITWTTNATIAEVKRIVLSYTLNNGLTWKTIDTSVDSANDGSFTWNVPTVTSPKNNSKVKIVLKDASGNTVGSDVSDVFTIQLP